MEAQQADGLSYGAALVQLTADGRADRQQPAQLLKRRVLLLPTAASRVLTLLLHDSAGVDRQPHQSLSAVTTAVTVSRH